MIQLKSFNPKSMIGNEFINFKKEIYGNEVAWTYEVAKLAKKIQLYINLLQVFRHQTSIVYFLKGSL